MREVFSSDPVDPVIACGIGSDGDRIPRPSRDWWQLAAVAATFVVAVGIGGAFLDATRPDSIERFLEAHHIRVMLSSPDDGEPAFRCPQFHTGRRPNRDRRAVIPSYDNLQPLFRDEELDPRRFVERRLSAPPGGCVTRCSHGLACLRSCPPRTRHHGPFTYDALPTTSALSLRAREPVIFDFCVALGRDDVEVCMEEWLGAGSPDH